MKTTVLPFSPTTITGAAIYEGTAADESRRWDFQGLVEAIEYREAETVEEAWRALADVIRGVEPDGDWPTPPFLLRVWDENETPHDRVLR